jgi:hypothetical protein
MKRRKPLASPLVLPLVSRRFFALPATLALGLLPGLAWSSAADDELSAKATDPTASLMSFGLNNWYAAELHDVGGTINQVALRAVLPFEALGTNHIFRVTQPFVTNSPGKTGTADTTVFDLMVFGAPWGRWGVGVAGSLPTGTTGLSSEKWSFGPSVGFVNNSVKTLSYGLFVQSYFAMAGKSSAQDVGVINVQPILSHQLGGGRSISLGSSQFVYDTEKSRWASLQLGLNYGQVVSAWGHKWRPSVEADYDFRSLTGNPAWTIRVGVNLLIPR